MLFFKLLSQGDFQSQQANISLASQLQQLEHSPKYDSLIAIVGSRIPSIPVLLIAVTANLQGKKLVKFDHLSIYQIWLFYSVLS